MHQTEWKQIYEKHYKPLYLYALSLTGNQQDAEDLLQETFIKAYLSYKEGGNITYWLITVLKNEYLNLQRKRKREILDNGETLLNQEPSGEDLLANLIAQEERRHLFHAILKLPLPMREILMETVYFHMKDEEIAALHHISRENVRKIRSRAKQKLIQNMILFQLQ